MHKYILIYVLQRRRSHSAALGRGSADGVRRGKAAPTLPYAQPPDAAASARGARSTHQALGVLAEPVERAHDALTRERVERAERRRRVLRRRRRRACAVRLKPPRKRPTATATYNGVSANGNGHPHALRTETGGGRRERRQPNRKAGAQVGRKPGAGPALQGLERHRRQARRARAARRPRARRARRRWADGRSRRTCGEYRRSASQATRRCVSEPTDPCLAVDIATAAQRRDRAHDATMAHRATHAMRAACALEDVAAARVAVDVALGVDQRAAARAARERAQEAWLAAAARHPRCCVAPWWAALGCAVGWRESHGGVLPGRTRQARGVAPLRVVRGVLSVARGAL